MNEPFVITWRDGAYYVSIPNYKGGTVIDASAFNALVRALEEIEDLGANGATAARLGNIAHAALLSLRVVGSPADERGEA